MEKNNSNAKPKESTLRLSMTNNKLIMAVCTCSLLCTCSMARAEQPHLQSQQAKLDERAPLRGGVSKVDKGTGEQAQTPRSPVKAGGPGGDSTSPPARIQRQASSPMSPPSLKVRDGALGSRAGRGSEGGTDRNVNELDLAWEQWHKQISKALWKRMSKLSAGTDRNGWARATITVNKNQEVTFRITSSDGDSEVAECYEDAIAGLDGNPDLEFPEGSQRKFVRFSLKASQGHFSHASYDWNHGDVEKIREEDD